MDRDEEKEQLFQPEEGVKVEIGPSELKDIVTETFFQQLEQSGDNWNPFAGPQPCQDWWKKGATKRTLKEFKALWKKTVIDDPKFYGFSSFTTNLVDRLVASVWWTDFILGEKDSLLHIYLTFIKPNRLCSKCAMKDFLDSLDLKIGVIGKQTNPVTFPIAEAIAIAFDNLQKKKDHDDDFSSSFFQSLFYATDFHTQSACRKPECVSKKVVPEDRVIFIKKPNQQILHRNDFVKCIKPFVEKKPPIAFFTYRNWNQFTHLKPIHLANAVQSLLKYGVMDKFLLYGRHIYIMGYEFVDPEINEKLNDAKGKEIDPKYYSLRDKQRSTLDRTRSELDPTEFSETLDNSIERALDVNDDGPPLAGNGSGSIGTVPPLKATGSRAGTRDSYNEPKEHKEFTKNLRHFSLEKESLRTILIVWLNGAITWKAHIAREQAECALRVAAYKLFVQISSLPVDRDDKIASIHDRFEDAIRILHHQIFTAAGDSVTAKKDEVKGANAFGVQITDLLFREVLCLVAEQLQHCPSRMNYLYTTLRPSITGFQSTQDAKEFIEVNRYQKRYERLDTYDNNNSLDYISMYKFRISNGPLKDDMDEEEKAFEKEVVKVISENMDFIKGGIKEFKDNSLNFDDINDGGKWSREKLHKTYREPFSLLALFVILTKYIPELIELKVWFMFMLYVIFIQSTHELTTDTSHDLMQKFVLVDVVMLLYFFVGSWLIRIVSTVFFRPCACNCALYLKPKNKDGYYLIGRLVFEALVSFGAIGYLCYGLFVVKKDLAVDSILAVCLEMFWPYVCARGVQFAIQILFPMSPMTRTRNTIDKKNDSKNICFKCDGCKGIVKRVSLRIVFIGLFFLITGLYEYFMVVAKFDSLKRSYCGDREHLTFVYEGGLADTQALICDFSWISLWLVTGAGLIIDNGLAFTVLMSMFGLLMGIQRQGESRGLVRVSHDELAKKIYQRFSIHINLSHTTIEENREELFNKVWPWALKYWRKQDLISNKEKAMLNEKVIDISKLRSPQAREVIGFWINSLSTQPLRRDKFQDIPKSTILIPVYEEKLEFAWRDNPRAPYAPLDEARHLIAKYPVHWLNLQERIAEEGKRKIFYPDASKRPPRVAPLVKSKMIFSSIEEYRNYHIANWLSMHDQLVYRTVKGAASYFKSLTFLAQLELERELQSTEKRKDLAKRKAQEKIEIVLCFQTYQGNYFEVSPIIHKWLKKWPFLKVCYDYKRDTNLKTEMINNIPPLYDYATVCLTWEAEPNGKETLVHRIIPRENPLLLVNTAGERIQGKAMNQLNGLMFLTGQFLQVLDANQGGHATEYLKFPALLENFKVNKVTGIPRRRIIGAREFIFTAALGRVANYHAYQEWSFGTLVLRVYSDLGIRLHYGHPDVFHAPWARGHSGLSKINPNINTSEDVFAGFETMLSKERTKHLEHIQFEKGRETGLQNMTGFDMKISAGNACLLRSRDMYHLTERLPLVKRFLFFYGIAGHFLTNTMMVISMYWYIWALFFFSLAGVSLQAIGGTIFATEWLLHAGFTTVIPLFAELLVERGPTLGFLEALLFVPISTIVYLFQMQSKHAGFVHGMVTGTSAHINTGRGLQIYRRSSHVLFTTYAHTHLYPMFEIITITVCYWSIAKELNGGSLPMIMIYVFCFCVLSAPQLFNPTLKGSTLPEVLRDIIQFVSWIGKPSSLNSIKDWENNMKEITEADAEFIRYSAQKDKESLPTGKIGIAFVLAHFFFSFGFWLAIAIFLLYPTMQYWLVFFLEGWFYYILFYAIFSCLPFISKSWSAYITPVSLLLLLAWGIGFVVVLVVFSSNRRVPWTEVGISFFIFIKLLAAFRTCILNFVIVAAFHKFPSKIEEKLKDKQQRNAFIMYFIVFTNHIFLTSSLRSTMALLWGFYSFIIGLLMRPLWGNLFLFGRFTGLAPIEVVGSDGARIVLDPEKIEETILKPLQQWKLTNK